MMLSLPLSENGAELGTRQRTITPVALTNVPGILASELPLYAVGGNTVGCTTINFLGELQPADNPSGPWSDVANLSPYVVSATNTANYCRAVE